MSDYRGRMMDVRGKSASMMAGDVSKYTEGHRDARRACAEIASEADEEIERLRSEVARLRYIACEVEMFDTRRGSDAL